MCDVAIEIDTFLKATVVVKVRIIFCTFLVSLG